MAGMGEQPYWSLSTHTMPFPTKAGAFVTRQEPALCLSYLEQAPGTNPLTFTKPLGKAVRQIKGRKATIKDYQTPSLPGERPGAIHF